METLKTIKVSYVYLRQIMKEKIVIKSADLFLTYGFKSVTMDDIANALGISKKTIYVYFKYLISVKIKQTQYLTLPI